MHTARSAPPLRRVGNGNISVQLEQPIRASRKSMRARHADAPACLARQQKDEIIALRSPSLGQFIRESVI